MPYGGGKSTLCRKFGFIDVDKILIGSEINNKMIRTRRALCCAVNPNWTPHHKVWI